MRELIVRNLKKGYSVAQRDAKTFEAWMKGEINLKEAKSQFKENNHIADSTFEKVDDKTFKNFMLSLGWYLDEDEKGKN